MSTVYDIANALYKSRKFSNERAFVNEITDHNIKMNILQEDNTLKIILALKIYVLNRGKLFTINSLQEVLSSFTIVIAYIQANYPNEVDINEAYED